MKITVVSDLHMNLPEIEQCDLLLIAGDICNGFILKKKNIQVEWMDSRLRKWFTILFSKKIQKLFQMD